MNRTLRFSIAALVLVVATLSIWHWRFTVVPDAVTELELASPLVGWKVDPHCKYEVVMEDGQPLLRLERGDPTEKLPSIYAWLGERGGLDEVAAIHIRCKARWKNVQVGPEGYTIARIVTMMRDAGGNVMHPPDFWITGGVGSRGWHDCEVVSKVTDDMEDLGVEISMLGLRGLLEVKDLSVVAVRNRPWVPAATVAVLAGWFLFVSLLFRCHAHAPSVWRTMATSAAVVSLSWFFVFPQTKGMLLPILGHFELGEIDVPAPKLPPETVPEAPSVPVVPTSPIDSSLEVVEHPAKPKQAEVVRPPSAKPEHEVHSSSALHKALRAVDKRLPVVHLGLFVGITLLVLFMTGRGNQWRIPLALAVLSELVPELTDHLGGWDDWADVLQNFAGVGLAVLIWKYLPVLRRLSAFFDSKPASP